MTVSRQPSPQFVLSATDHDEKSIQKMLEPAVKPDVLFIGAGPVGLWTAIQLKLYDPKLNIVMMEKYKEYQRTHVLNIEKSSFVGSHPNAEFQKLIATFAGKIRTTDLENQLLEFAKNRGIKIEYQQVTDCKAVHEQYPSASIIVGADGAHSLVREKIFGNDLDINKKFKYIMQLKYEAKGATRPMEMWKESIPALSYTHHLVSETVGKEKDGKTPITLSIFISENEFKSMNEARGKKYFTLHDEDKIGEQLMHTLHAWLYAREVLVGEKRIADSERVTVTELSVYRSHRFLKELYGVKWLLLGDAAHGFPFFRSLNVGMLGGNRLANAIYQHLHPELQQQPRAKFFSSSSIASLSRKEPLQEYCSYLQSLTAKESREASKKNIGVSSLAAGAHSIEKIGVSRYKLPKDARHRIDQMLAVADSKNNASTPAKPKISFLSKPAPKHVSSSVPLTSGLSKCVIL